MDELFDGGISLVKVVFYTIGMCVLCVMLYTFLFKGDNSALQALCRNSEEPVAKYYYTYSYYPSVHCNDGVATSLGISSNKNTDLSSSDTDDSTSVCGYSTGWK